MNNTVLLITALKKLPLVAINTYTVRNCIMEVQIQRCLETHLIMFPMSKQERRTKFNSSSL